MLKICQNDILLSVCVMQLKLATSTNNTIHIKASCKRFMKHHCTTLKKEVNTGISHQKHRCLLVAHGLLACSFSLPIYFYVDCDTFHTSIAYDCHEDDEQFYPLLLDQLFATSLQCYVLYVMLYLIEIYYTPCS